MTKNLKTEKENNVLDNPETEMNERAIGIFLDKKSKSWKVAFLQFDVDTGLGKVKSVHGSGEDDKYTAIERFKIMAVEEGLV